jgi:hypothetical protein
MACCGIEDEQQVNFNEDWNVDLQNAVNKLLAQKDTFIIPGDGRDEEEQSFILVENSVPVSYGFLPKHAAIRNREELDTYAKPLDSSGLGQQILLGYMERNNLFKVPFF